VNLVTTTLWDNARVHVGQYQLHRSFEGAK
jgi:hypothetical protein